jgi:hypothetical protein
MARQRTSLGSGERGIFLRNGYHKKRESTYFSDKQMVYGAGYGRSMKAVFFLAEKIEQRTVAGIPVLILGKERAKEMASPFAMAQDGVIFVRKESLRFFLWDHI